jgi:hypothetical protein
MNANKSAVGVDHVTTALAKGRTNADMANIFGELVPKYLIDMDTVRAKMYLGYYLHYTVPPVASKTGGQGAPTSGDEYKVTVFERLHVLYCALNELSTEVEPHCLNEVRKEMLKTLAAMSPECEQVVGLFQQLFNSCDSSVKLEEFINATRVTFAGCDSSIGLRLIWGLSELPDNNWGAREVAKESLSRFFLTGFFRGKTIKQNRAFAEILHPILTATPDVLKIVVQHARTLGRLSVIAQDLGKKVNVALFAGSLSFLTKYITGSAQKPSLESN